MDMRISLIMSLILFGLFTNAAVVSSSLNRLEKVPLISFSADDKHSGRLITLSYFKKRQFNRAQNTAVKERIAKPVKSNLSRIYCVLQFA